MSEEIGRGLTRILSFLIATAVVLLGCAANSVGETSGLAAVSVAESAATAVPSPPPPTVMAPVAPTAVLTRQPLPTSTPPPPVFANPLDDDMAQTAVAYDAEFIHFTPENSGIWAYTANSFLHPIALEVWQETAFLLDGGRVLAINLTKPTPPRVLLASGDTVDGARVMEPLDLTVGEAGLYVLDRVGDVYRYELADGRWHLERYDRPVSDTSGHYYVALDTEADAQFLLEANYKIGIQTASDTPDLAWPLPDVRAVDISAQGEDVYVLAREMDTWAGRALRYQNTVSMIYFKPPKIISQPRQIAAGETAVYILDQAGKRLLACDRETG
ncbi:MAG: hypothetical protein GY803_19465, partial [Chloroflexi bacterium]|nr:hypothetical protein [Chloroflexota bacterium]